MYCKDVQKTIKSIFNYGETGLSKIKRSKPKDVLHHLTFRVSSDQLKTLDSQANDINLSRAAYIKKIVLDHIEEVNESNKG